LQLNSKQGVIEVTIDLERARRDTPAVEQLIHLNNAGASLQPNPVLDAVFGHLRREAEIGGYEAEHRAADQLAHFYDAAATLLGCARDEIAFSDGASRAWGAAFYAIPFKAGDRILVSTAEYVSNYMAILQVSQRTGALVEVIANDEQGQTSPAALRQMLDERVKLIAITQVATNSGLVNPAAEIGQVAKEAGVLYLLDACQSVGQMPVSVEEIGCDFLAATGRKYLRGPRSTGLLYVRRAIAEQLEPAMMDTGGAEWLSASSYSLNPAASRFESYELNFAGKIGLGVAIDYALSWGLDSIQERVMLLADYLRAQLATLATVTVRDLGVDRCGIVTFTVAGREPEAIRAALWEQQINVWVSYAGSARLDMDARGLDKLLRASVHYYNTEAELDRFCTTLAKIAGG